MTTLTLFRILFTIFALHRRGHAFSSTARPRDAFTRIGRMSPIAQKASDREYTDSTPLIKPLKASNIQYCTS